MLILLLQIHSLGGAVIGTVAVGVAAAGVAIITLNPVAIVTAIVGRSYYTSAPLIDLRTGVVFLGNWHRHCA